MEIQGVGAPGCYCEDPNPASPGQTPKDRLSLKLSLPDSQPSHRLDSESRSFLQGGELE